MANNNDPMEKLIREAVADGLEMLPTMNQRQFKDYLESLSSDPRVLDRILDEIPRYAQMYPHHKGVLLATADLLRKSRDSNYSQAP